MTTESGIAAVAAVPSPFVDVPAAIEEIRAGRMVVVVDDEDRENEGDLTLAAQFVTPEAINFMARFGRGLICLTLTEERADHLHLPPMTQRNSSRFGTAFTESIEAREGVSTGISAHDRAHTIRTAIAPESTAADLARPGHVFPLRARQGGVLVRAGQTEASVDLARMAGLEPAGVICEIMNEDGTMARVPDLVRFCAEHQLKMLTVAELIRYRLRHERYIRRVGQSSLTNRFGTFRLIAYESEINGGESHLALVYGNPDETAAQDADHRPVLVRVHTHCTAGDVFAAQCNCRALLDASMQRIAEEGCGAIVYLHNTSRGFDWDGGQMLLHPDQRAREANEDRHRRIVRAVGLGGQILTDLGIQRIRLLSNTPMHVPALHGFGLEIVEQVPIPLGDSARS